MPRPAPSSTALLLPLVVVCVLAEVAVCSSTAPQQATKFAVPTQGSTRQICNSKDLPDGPHYINDHTLIQGPDGSWHLYGIFHHEPADPEHEVDFVHAVSTEADPTKWTSTSFVIPPPGSPLRYALVANASLQETHIWAPHVMRDSARERWVMVFQASNYHGNNNAAQIKVATSTDLYHWTRHPKSFVFTDICVARDPKLVQHSANSWAVYYTRCNNVTGELSGVAFRTTSDFAEWSEPTMALVLPPTSPPFNPSFNSAASESSFVFQRDGVWYLSLCAPTVTYKTTLLFASTSPTHFEPTPVATFEAHCAEWINGTHMTSAGWGQGGVFVSPMTWPA